MAGLSNAATMLHNRPIRVLLVDDQQQWLDLWGIWLRAEGLCVTTSLNAADLQNKIIMENPDVILLDLFLDKKDGAIICRSLKADAATAGIPVILFSSHRQLEKIASESGADAYIPKSATPAELKQKLLQLLG